jgi:hypothetical protein
LANLASLHQYINEVTYLTVLWQFRAWSEAAVLRTR